MVTLDQLQERVAWDVDTVDTELARVRAAMQGCNGPELGQPVGADSYAVARDVFEELYVFHRQVWADPGSLKDESDRESYVQTLTSNFPGTLGLAVLPQQVLLADIILQGFKGWQFPVGWAEQFLQTSCTDPVVGRVAERVLQHHKSANRPSP